MKKLLLSFFTLVFAVGFTMAQNSSTVDTKGDDNLVDVNQNGSSNTAAVTQGRTAGSNLGPSTANNSEVDIDQNGTGNSATGFQNGNNNFIRQDQLGDNNTATVDAQRDFNEDAPYTNSRSFAEGGNEHYQLQYGNENTAKATVLNGPNFGRQYQEGNDNDSELFQSGEVGNGFNEAYIDQIGNDNKNRVRQENSTGALADLEQTGDRNYAKTLQSQGPDNQIFIVQNGSDNRVGFTPASQNDPGLTQDGSDNQAYVDQQGSNNLVETSLQQGASNYADVDQLTDGNKALFQQVGDDNDITILQQGGDGNTARSRMTAGNNNDLNFYQNGTGNTAITETWGDNNIVDIDQLTDNNTVRYNMRGTPPAPGGGVDNNDITILQEGGNGNTATGYIDGADNDHDVFQNGTGNTSDVDLIGDNNGQMSTIGNGLIDQDGTDNEAIMSATGDNNSFLIDQDGSNNFSTNTATGSNNEVHVTQSNMTP